jgi:outer membrane receptor protein involved in Fe transport
VAALPPEQAFAPENMGTVLDLENVSQRAQPYVSSDVVLAGYGMLDFFPIRGVRLVGGVRYEDWQLDITPQGVGGAVDSLGNPVDVTQTTRQPDLLWSGNLTIAFGSRTNLRFAGFRSVTRPDAREKSSDVAVPVAGACETRGDTALQRAAAINLDARFEFYRRPGEVISASVFYKQFDLPIVETRATPGGSQCQLITRNGEEAWNYGLELELRRAILPDVTAGINLTLVQSRVTMPAYLGTFASDLPLQGQSPYLVNANLTWAPRARRLSASVLYNYFADRIASYGTAAQGAEAQGPNLYEKGRSRLDAKVEVGVGPRGSVSVSGRNLLNSVSEFYHPTETIGDVRAGYSREGVSWSLGFGYAF